MLAGTTPMSSEYRKSFITLRLTLAIIQETTP
jgi:hypothetical protein